MRWNTIDRPIEEITDPLDEMSDCELEQLLDDIREPLIQAWPDGALIFEVPKALEDPNDLEHQVVKKLRERELQPELNIIAERVSRSLRDALRKPDPGNRDLSPKNYRPK